MAYFTYGSLWQKSSTIVTTSFSLGRSGKPIWAALSISSGRRSEKRPPSAWPSKKTARHSSDCANIIWRMATMWSDTVLRRIAKCALPSFGKPLPVVLNPQYPVLATGVLPPRDGPKGSPFFLGRTGVSLIKDMSGAGSSLSPLKSRPGKIISRAGCKPDGGSFQPGSAAGAA